MNKVLWEPNHDYIKKTNLTNYMLFLQDNFSININNYDELWTWSVKENKLFWKSLWDYFGIIHSNTYSTILKNENDFPPNNLWFEGAKLNFAENLLRYNDDTISFIFESELIGPKSISYKELNDKVRSLAVNLKKIGIKKGDRVSGYLPNLIETAISMLATTALGAIWSSCGTELGSDAAADRLGQVEPKCLITVKSYSYKSIKFNHLPKVEKLRKQINSIENVILVPYLENYDKSSDSDYLNFEDLINEKFENFEFEQMDFSDPVYIMFSSGTTGKPKCMVQSIGGILLNHMKELSLNGNLQYGDSMIYLASPSWMMWNWMMTSLSLGVTILLYEGNPLYPDWKTIWNLLEKYKISFFGCSATYIHYLKNLEVSPIKEFNLEYLKQISQTGSVLSDEGYDFIFEEIKKDVYFNSISGGTDINGCFATGVPILPLHKNELQGRGLGMAVYSYDHNGNPVYDKNGELVCTKPSPSMPIYFWKDSDGSKYHDAYFKYYADTWRHGDYIKINSKTNGISFYGRSDSVLNPSGVRIGTSEIYNIVEELPEIKDSLVIGQEHDNDQRIILFVQLNDKFEFNEELKLKIKSELKNKASPRHSPNLIYSISDIPYTFSGKKVESAITNIFNNTEITNLDAFRNPECISEFHNISKELLK